MNGTVPIVTLTKVDLGETKSFSAVDDESNTSMKYVFQLSPNCSDTPNPNSKVYEENTNISFTNWAYDSQYLCFWSEDLAGECWENFSLSYRLYWNNFQIGLGTQPKPAEVLQVQTKSSFL